MKQSPNHLLDAIDLLIRSGHLTEARHKLIHFKRNQLPRDNLFQFAALARRARLLDVSLLSLRPYVRPPDRKAVMATSAEKAEYASTLSDLGATNEALTLLKSVNPNDYPQTLLYTAFALFTRWEYEKTIPILMNYVQLQDKNLIQKTVGEANLASALLFARDPRAHETVLQLLEHTKEAKYRIAEGYAELLNAESEIYQTRFDNSKAALERAEAIFTNPQAIEYLIVRKWRAILELYQSNGRADKIDSVRVEALERKHWETVRHCDYHKAIVQKNQELFLRLYFGTPFPAFREKLIKEFAIPVDLPEEFIWNPKSEIIDSHKNIIQLFNNAPSGLLKLGQTTFRILKVLASDHYHPHRIAELFAELYPNEFYNPRTSVLKTHQVIFRTRELLKRKKLPVTIEEENETYHLKLKPGYALALPNMQNSFESVDFLMQKLTHAVGVGTALTLREIQEHTLLPNRWATQRFLFKAIKKGLIFKRDRGTKTRYVLQKSTERLTA